MFSPQIGGQVSAVLRIESDDPLNPLIEVSLLGVADFPPVTIQVVPLAQEWNIFSSYVVPEQTDLLQVLGVLIDEGTLEKVQDETGKPIVRFFGSWVNEIGQLQASEGYYAKVNANTELVLQGSVVGLPLTIDLSDGWNIIGYPNPAPEGQDAMAVLRSTNKQWNLGESPERVRATDHKILRQLGQ